MTRPILPFPALLAALFPALDPRSAAPSQTVRRTGRPRRAAHPTALAPPPSDRPRRRARPL